MSWKDEWTTGSKTEIADDCSHCNADSATFILTDKLFGVIAKLCEDIESEWQMLLIGEESEDNVVIMHDYYVPKQEVTSATVTNIDCIDKQRIEELGIVGTIHSHSSMAVFFSSKDEESTNTSLIKNHIVCNNDGKYVGTKALDLPCGMKKFIPANVTRDMPKIVMAKNVKGIKNIEKKTYSYPKGGYYGGGGYLGGRESFCDAGDTTPYLLGGKRKKHAFQFEAEKEVTNE